MVPPSDVSQAPMSLCFPVRTESLVSPQECHDSTLSPWVFKHKSHAKQGPFSEAKIFHDAFTASSFLKSTAFPHETPHSSPWKLETVMESVNMMSLPH